MACTISADSAMLAAELERIKALRRLADALTDVPYFFTTDEVEAMEGLDTADGVQSETY